MGLASEILDNYYGRMPPQQWPRETCSPETEEDAIRLRVMEYQREAEPLLRELGRITQLQSQTVIIRDGKLESIVTNWNAEALKLKEAIDEHLRYLQQIILGFRL